MRPILPLLTLLMLAGCNGDMPGEWSAIVYADASDLSDYQTTRGFQSLGMCRRAAQESIAALPQPKKASYRCGFQCQPDPGAPGRGACQAFKQ